MWVFAGISVLVSRYSVNMVEIEWSLLGPNYQVFSSRITRSSRGDLPSLPGIDLLNSLIVHLMMTKGTWVVRSGPLLDNIRHGVDWLLNSQRSVSHNPQLVRTRDKAGWPVEPAQVNPKKHTHTHTTKPHFSPYGPCFPPRLFFFSWPTNPSSIRKPLLPHHMSAAIRSTTTRNEACCPFAFLDSLLLVPSWTSFIFNLFKCSSVFPICYL